MYADSVSHFTGRIACSCLGGAYEAMDVILPLWRNVDAFCSEIHDHFWKGEEKQSRKKSNCWSSRSCSGESKPVLKLVIEHFINSGHRQILRREIMFISRNCFRRVFRSENLFPDLEFYLSSSVLSVCKCVWQSRRHDDHVKVLVWWFRI